MSILRLVKICIVAAMVGLCGMNTGCTKKPSADELSKLDEAKSAAEGAEKKLFELKQERQRLEGELQQKQDELKKSEEERDDIKKKVGK
jgi:septal ring factor EnvC (AmiA/AmiB activator)